MEQKFMRCSVCGNLMEVLGDSGVVPVCCDKPMTELKANSSDGAGEKHVPVIQREGSRVIVRVGSVEHPMQQEHYIQWIALSQGARHQRVFLNPGDAPTAEFTADAQAPVTAYEYCNLHGLWKAEG